MATSFLRVGRVVEKLAPRISRVEVLTNELDPYLTMFFSRFDDLKVDDNNLNVMVGDYVLLHKTDNPRRIDLPYQVRQLLLKTGFLIDPLTKRRVVGWGETVSYLDQYEELQRIAHPLAHQSPLKNVTIPNEVLQATKDQTKEIT